MLDATAEKARERLGLVKVDQSNVVPVPTNASDLENLLKRKFRNTRFFDDKDGRSLIMNVPMAKDRIYPKKPRAINFHLKPYGKKNPKIIVKYDVLYNAKNVKRGYRIPDKKNPWLDRYSQYLI